MNNELINKYIAGDVSQEEKEAVQLWIESNDKNRKLYMSLRSLYDVTIGNLPEENGEKIIYINDKHRLFTSLLKIAAAVLITFGCTYVFLQSRQNSLLLVALMFFYNPGRKRLQPLKIQTM